MHGPWVSSNAANVYNLYNLYLYNLPYQYKNSFEMPQSKWNSLPYTFFPLYILSHMFWSKLILFHLQGKECIGERIRTIIYPMKCFQTHLTCMAGEVSPSVLKGSSLGILSTKKRGMVLFWGIKRYTQNHRGERMYRNKILFKLLLMLQNHNVLLIPYRCII